MARWKPVAPGVGDPPRVNQRIDGTIFTYNQQTNTLNKWSYPNRSKSRRFQTINGIIQNLDRNYDTLSAPEKAAWAAAWTPEQWYLNCWIWDENQMPVPPDSPGLAQYREVNVALYDQGLSFVTTPPISLPIPSINYVSFATPQWTAAFFLSTFPDPAGYYWTIYGRPANTTPLDTPQPDKAMTYITTQQIIPYTAYDLTTLLDDSGVFGTCAWKAIEIRVGVQGDAPSLRFRAS